MKVLEKSIMQDGTKIQIENWKEDYKSINTISITAFPVAKKTNYKDILHYPRQGETFRLDINLRFNSDEEVKETFEKLKHGTISLVDLQNHFREKERVEYL